MTVLPNGDGSVILEFGGSPSYRLSERLSMLGSYFEARPGITDVVPAYTSLMLVYDPELLPAENLRQLLFDIEELGGFTEHADSPSDGNGHPVDASTDSGTGRLIEIPVRYSGPDLEAVATHAELSIQQVIERHAANIYLVHFLGFMPGFPYLGGMDPALACPRRQTPRMRVSAGSVGIAGEQTGIYPLDSPGGWQIIGHTALKLFDPDRPEPFLLKATDRIRFIPVPGPADASLS